MSIYSANLDLQYPAECNLQHISRIRHIQHDLIPHCIHLRQILRERSPDVKSHSFPRRRPSAQSCLFFCHAPQQRLFPLGQLLLQQCNRRTHNLPRVVLLNKSERVRDANVAGGNDGHEIVLEPIRGKAIDCRGDVWISGFLQLESIDGDDCQVCAELAHCALHVRVVLGFCEEEARDVGIAECCYGYSVPDHLLTVVP